MTTPLFLKDNKIRLSDLKIIRQNTNEYKMSQKIAGIKTNITLVYDDKNKLIKEINPFFNINLITDKKEISNIIDTVENKKKNRQENTIKTDNEIDISKKVDNIKNIIKRIEKKQIIKNTCDLLKK
jgi:hypothetical protein